MSCLSPKMKQLFIISYKCPKRVIARFTDNDCINCMIKCNLVTSFGRHM